jgi:hypothetical protein
VVDRIAQLNPRQIVPDHGELGGAELVGQEREFLADLDAKATAMKAQGMPADAAGSAVLEDFQKRYPDWTGLNNVRQSVQRAYANDGRAPRD